MKRIKFLIKISLLLGLVILIINLYVNYSGKPYIYKNTSEVPECYTALVLGAFVYKSGNPSGFLRDRLDKSIELYQSGKIKRFLLSGDHGHKDYDEVNNMKDYLVERGIGTKDIFMDHAGFDTYNSIVRAKEIFDVNDVIIVSQEFHLPRAVFIARKKGLNAYGISAKDRAYGTLVKLKSREVLANLKATFEVIINKKPKFFGEKIPISGDSKLSYD